MYDNHEAIYWAWKADPTEANLSALSKALFAYAEGITIKTLGRRDDDLTGQIVTRALLAEPSFEGRSKFTTWFYRLAFRECISHVRRIRTRKECVFDESMSLEDDFYSSVPEIHSAILVKELLASLSERDAGIMRAKMGGYTTKEIAESTGLRTEGVRKRWRVLKLRLRKLLSESSQLTS